MEFGIESIEACDYRPVSLSTFGAKCAMKAGWLHELGSIDNGQEEHNWSASRRDNGPPLSDQVPMTFDECRLRKFSVQSDAAFVERY